ncbi:hypothetical protein U1Q18_022761 [Sarracenia purpurea var. burkii]
MCIAKSLTFGNEKNDPEIAEGNDVPASTPTSHKVSGPVSVFCEPVSSYVVHGLNGDFDSAHMDKPMVHMEGNSCFAHLVLDEMPHPVLVNKTEEVRDSDESEVEENTTEEDCMSCSDDVALPVGDKMNQVHEFEHPTVHAPKVFEKIHQPTFEVRTIGAVAEPNSPKSWAKIVAPKHNSRAPKLNQRSFSGMLEKKVRLGSS